MPAEKHTEYYSVILMKKKFYGKKYKVLLIITLFLLLGIFTASVTENSVSPLSTAVSFILSPIQKAATGIADKLADTKMYFTSASKYKEQIDALTNELNDYKSRLVEFEKNKKKMEAYKEFLEIKEQNPDYTFVSATVISRNSDDIYGTFTIDMGRGDGVSVSDPVIYGETLVGIVSEVFENSATVYTLFNPNVNVSVYEVLTRFDCILESDNLLTMQGYLKLTGLSGSSSIEEGGIIATSGVGGKYPPDLIIGTVSEIIEDEASNTVYALITPEINSDELRDVFVLTGFNK